MQLSDNDSGRMQDETAYDLASLLQKEYHCKHALS